MTTQQRNKSDKLHNVSRSIEDSRIKVRTTWRGLHGTAAWKKKEFIEHTYKQARIPSKGVGLARKFMSGMLREEVLRMKAQLVKELYNSLKQGV